MIPLICVSCGNKRFFESDIDTVKEISVNGEGVVVDNAVFDDWDYTDDTLRRNLSEMIEYVIMKDSSMLSYDHETGYYYNSEIFCSVCGSPRVCPPFTEWHPRNDKTLDQEIISNRKEYNRLRKERKRNENNLPVLWQSEKFSDTPVGKMHFPF